MNPRQMALQIRHELRKVTWPAGSKVFNDRAAFIFAGVPDEDQHPPGFPFVMIGLDGGTADEDAPELIDSSFKLLVVAAVEGSPLGEFAIIGGGRADMGKSAGAGVAEVDERVRSAVQDLVGSDGAKIILSATSMGAVSNLGQKRHVAYGEIDLTAICTSGIHYAAPQQIVQSGTTWTWEGVHCSDRFDFLQYRLGYLAGSTPPETPGDATIVYTGTAATTTHTVVTSPVVYSVFADYNSRVAGQSTVEGSSSGSEVGAYLTL